MLEALKRSSALKRMTLTDQPTAEPPADDRPRIRLETVAIDYWHANGPRPWGPVTVIDRYASIADWLIIYESGGWRMTWQPALSDPTGAWQVVRMDLYLIGKIGPRMQTIWRGVREAPEPAPEPHSEQQSSHSLARAYTGKSGNREINVVAEPTNGR